jgi:hypothetical protein
MLLLVSLTNSFAVTQAQVKPQFAAANESPNSIRFVKAEGGMLVFELRLANLPANGSIIRILDGDNNTLFEERITTEICNKRYKISRGEISKISFEISGRKIFMNQSFEVRSRTEEKIEVTRA